MIKFGSVNDVKSRNRESQNMNIALIFAGGIGQRMKNIIPKQFVKVNEKPILLYTILNFEDHEEIDAIAVVCIESWLDELRNIIKSEGITKVKWIVAGAQTGQQSIYNGLKAIYDEVSRPNEVIVLISDGVRPVVSKEIISNNIECVKKNRTSVTVYPVPETIVELDTLGCIYNIPVRKQCFLSKAPQGFYLSDIMDAHNKSIAENRFDCTNSAELMRRYRHALFTVPDSEENIKITTPLDIKIFKAILDEEKNSIS